MAFFASVGCLPDLRRAAGACGESRAWAWGELTCRSSTSLLCDCLTQAPNLEAFQAMRLLDGGAMEKVLVGGEKLLRVLAICAVILCSTFSVQQQRMLFKVPGIDVFEEARLNGVGEGMRKRMDYLQHMRSRYISKNMQLWRACRYTFMWGNELNLQYPYQNCLINIMLLAEEPTCYFQLLVSCPWVRWSP